MSCLNLTTMSMQISNSILGLGLGSEVYVSLVKAQYTNSINFVYCEGLGLVNIPALLHADDRPTRYQVGLQVIHTS